jgi:NAD(P)-dependent dehydrogenase (short-subunit alcohol dehydrogenase family)
MKSLEGKVVAVTGSGRGIGRAIAHGVAAQGGRVVVADFGGALGNLAEGSPGPAATVAREIRAAGGSAVACAENIATAAGAGRMVEAARDNWGRLDGLVCAAGLYNQGPLWETTDQEWDDVITSHLRGHFCCTRAAVPVMQKQKSGSLVCFSSDASYMTPPEAIAYNTAKAGVLGFMRTASRELRGFGIRVNAVLPGGATRMTDEIYTRWGILTEDVRADTHSEAANVKSEKTKAQGLGLKSELAAGTWRDPANVAPFVVYLLSDRAGKVQGQAFGVVGYQVTHLRGHNYGKTIRADKTWDVEELARRFDAELATELDDSTLPWPPA